MEHTWPFVVIDTTRYMTTLIFAITLPFLLFRIYNALFDVRDVASAARVSWRRWRTRRRYRQRGTIQQEFDEMMAARSAHLHRGPVTRSSH